MTVPIRLNPLEVDPAPGNYYVSVADIGSNSGKVNRLGLLLGPFTKHANALCWVEKSRNVAGKIDSRAFWYAFGTVRMADDYRKPGVLNDLILKGV